VPWASGPGNAVLSFIRSATGGSGSNGGYRRLVTKGSASALPRAFGTCGTFVFGLCPTHTALHNGFIINKLAILTDIVTVKPSRHYPNPSTYHLLILL